MAEGERIDDLDGHVQALARAYPSLFGCDRDTPWRVIQHIVLPWGTGYEIESDGTLYRCDRVRAPASPAQTAQDLAAFSECRFLRRFYRLSWYARLAPEVACQLAPLSARHPLRLLFEGYLQRIVTGRRRGETYYPEEMNGIIEAYHLLTGARLAWQPPVMDFADYFMPDEPRDVKALLDYLVHGHIERTYPDRLTLNKQSIRQALAKLRQAGFGQAVEEALRERKRLAPSKKWREATARAIVDEVLAKQR